MQRLPRLAKTFRLSFLATWTLLLTTLFTVQAGTTAMTIMGSESGLPAPLGPEDSGLTKAQLGGIAGGVVVLLLTVIVVTFLIIRHMRRVTKAVESEKSQGEPRESMIPYIPRIKIVPGKGAVDAGAARLIDTTFGSSRDEGQQRSERRLSNARVTTLPAAAALAGVSALPPSRPDLDEGVGGQDSGETGPELGHTEKSPAREVEAPSIPGPDGTSCVPNVDSGDEESFELRSISTKSFWSSGSSITAPTLDIYKQRAVDALMDQFKLLLSHGPHIGLRVRAGGGGTEGVGGTSTTLAQSSSRSSGETTAGGKRGRDSQDPDRNERDGERPDPSKKARVNSSQFSRFACPFYVRNPKKHLRHRSCAGPGWTEVRRVKEHVYRTHALPIHCHRCGATMKLEADLRAHQRQPEGCEVRLVDLPEGFDPSQEKELRKKKHSENEEEKWYKMYRVLFPDEDGDLIPSPYYKLNDGVLADAETQQTEKLRQYERFQRRELLRVVRRLLEETVAGMAGPLEDRLRTQFVGIVRQAQSEVFQAYKEGDCKRSSGGQGHRDGGKQQSVPMTAAATVRNMEEGNNKGYEQCQLGQTSRPGQHETLTSSADIPPPVLPGNDGPTTGAATGAVEDYGYFNFLNDPTIIQTVLGIDMTTPPATAASTLSRGVLQTLYPHQATASEISNSSGGGSSDTHGSEAVETSYGGNQPRACVIEERRELHDEHKEEATSGDLEGDLELNTMLLDMDWDNMLNIDHT